MKEAARIEGFELGWRDVKHILASTSKQIDAGAPTLIVEDEIAGKYIQELPWQINGAGYHYHNWYGFGLVDVDRAVAMIQNNYNLLAAQGFELAACQRQRSSHTRR